MFETNISSNRENISFPGYRYADLLKKYPLLETVKKLMVPGFAEDDLVLQAVIVLGVVSMDLRRKVVEYCYFVPFI